MASYLYIVIIVSRHSGRLLLLLVGPYYHCYHCYSYMSYMASSQVSLVGWRASSRKLTRKTASAAPSGWSSSAEISCTHAMRALVEESITLYVWRSIAPKRPTGPVCRRLPGEANAKHCAMPSPLLPG